MPSNKKIRKTSRIIKSKRSIKKHSSKNISNKKYLINDIIL